MLDKKRRRSNNACHTVALPHCGREATGESVFMNTMNICRKAVKSEKLDKTFYERGDLSV